MENETPAGLNPVGAGVLLAFALLLFWAAFTGGFAEVLASLLTPALLEES